MDDEPLWLTFEDVEAIHEDQLARYGGRPGLKSADLVESALFAPQTLFHYENQDDILGLAVNLCVRIAKNHGWIDGNKRTGTVAMIEFLAINGWDLVIDDDEADEPTLGRWVEMVVEDQLRESDLYDLLYRYIVARD